MIILPQELINKIMLFNANPTAELIRNIHPTARLFWLLIPNWKNVANDHFDYSIDEYTFYKHYMYGGVIGGSNIALEYIPINVRWINDSHPGFNRINYYG